METPGNLVIGRKPGEGMFIGRVARVTIGDAAGSHCSCRREWPCPERGWWNALIHREVVGDAVTIAVESSSTVAVSGEERSIHGHLTDQARRESITESARPTRMETHEFVLLAGDRILIGRGIAVRLIDVAPDGYARLNVDAPRHMAVSRDDFTYEQHLTFQVEREAGIFTVPGR